MGLGLEEAHAQVIQGLPFFEPDGLLALEALGHHVSVTLRRFCFGILMT